MGKHHNDTQKRIFFIKPETLDKIIRLTKFPVLMLTISCSALLLTVALNQLPNFFILTIPDRECTFLNLSLDDQHHLESLLQEKTKSVSIFNGVEHLGRQLMKEMPTLAGVTCSLDRNKKLHVLATGKTLKNEENLLENHQACNESPSQHITEINLDTPAETSFNELLSSPAQTQQIASVQEPVIRPYTPSLLGVDEPFFNPEILVSGKRN